MAFLRIDFTIDRVGGYDLLAPVSLPYARSVGFRFDTRMHVNGRVPVDFQFDAHMFIAEGTNQRFDTRMQVTSQKMRSHYQTDLIVNSTVTQRFDARLRVFFSDAPREWRNDVRMQVVNTTWRRSFDARLRVYRVVRSLHDAKMRVVRFNPIAELVRMGSDSEHL